MATTRPFAYNPTQASISGTTNIGTLSIGVSDLEYNTNPGGITWWMGPDEDLGYVVAKDFPAGNYPTPLGNIGTVIFKRCPKNDSAFIALVNYISGTSQSTVNDALTWLSTNGYWSSYPSIVSSGLILNYNISDSASYPGTGSTITDLQGSSNATTANSPAYTSSGGGYLTFNGSNQYFVTNTSLNSKLSPVNTSTVLSIFVWVYPMDNGVIVSELGQTAPNTSWHDSQIEMVAGTIKFSVWSGSVQNLSSSISTPLNNWYYIGFTYDGTNLRGYVNGSLAVTSGTISRQTPYNNGGSLGLHYAVASIDGTSLGDGSYANMRFGGMQIYNTALSGPNVLTNYNAQKSRFGL
jgi:hypothetical protein